MYFKGDFGCIVGNWKVITEGEKQYYRLGVEIQGSVDDWISWWQGKCGKVDVFGILFWKYS